MEDCGVAERDGERFPSGLIHVVVEGLRIAELGASLRDLFPEREQAIGGLRVQNGRLCHRAERGRLDHRAILHEDAILRRNGDFTWSAFAPQLNSLIRPFQKWLESCGVHIEVDTTVTDIGFASKAAPWTVNKIRTGCSGCGRCPDEMTSHYGA
jgi:hypothetical protein